MVSEVRQRQLTFDKEAELENVLASTYFPTVSNSRHFDDDEMLMQSESAQHLVNEPDFKLLMMHLLNLFFDHIHQLGNLVNLSSELPDNAMKDLQQVYRQ